MANNEIGSREYYEQMSFTAAVLLEKIEKEMINMNRLLLGRRIHIIMKSNSIG